MPIDERAADVVDRRRPTVDRATNPLSRLREKLQPKSVSALLKEWRDQAREWLGSFALHLAIFLTLWFVAIAPRDRSDSFEAIDGQFSSGVGDSDSLEGVGLGFDQVTVIADENGGRSTAAEAVDRYGSEGSFDSNAAFANIGEESLSTPLEFGATTDAKASAEPIRPRTGRGKSKRTVALGKGFSPEIAGSLEGRTASERTRLAAAGGGNAASEKAVELGLAWLARHQRSDGSWSFQHGTDDPGALDCPTGATGLALLSFLGAGYTHKEGKYMSHVHGGLKYLIDQMDAHGSQGWLLGTGQATMYTQGIGAIALCEAYAMTKDKALRRNAELAIDFIIKAQDPESGGWRYRIPQAGDTSVVGWQVMALKSAKMIEIEIPSHVIVGVTQFLKSVESGGGALYGYVRPDGVRPSTTAVGLLCRMYLGRGKNDKGLIRGVDHLSNWAPRLDDMYYSFYATQVMHHWGGSPWERWNPVMRDLLVKSQVPVGEAAGSWQTDRSHGSNRGGRLYTTCLSIMTLEVYYRYLPLYRRPETSGSL